MKQMIEVIFNTTDINQLIAFESIILDSGLPNLEDEIIREVIRNRIKQLSQ